MRVIVVGREETQELFGTGETGRNKIMLVICQDTRPYDDLGVRVPDYNRRYDCGAAVQNMLLAAHMLGLGAVWLTFGERLRMKIRERYALPAYIEVSTFVGLGWPAENPLPPGRLSVDEAILT